MAKPQAEQTKKDRVRAFLVARPEMSHAEIADACDTTRGYVDQQSVKMRHEGKTRPQRKPARPPRDVSGLTDPSPTPSESHSVAVNGLRLVNIEQLTPRAVSQPPDYRCDVCKHEGHGPVPAACPKCGVS